MYNEVGDRIAQFLYAECSQIFGAERWKTRVASARSRHVACIVPMVLYKASADVILDRSMANQSDVSACSKDLKMIIRLRKGQAA